MKILILWTIFVYSSLAIKEKENLENHDKEIRKPNNSLNNSVKIIQVEAQLSKYIEKIMSLIEFTRVQ